MSTHIRRLAAVILLGSVLAACGGGASASSGAPAAPSTATNPAASAGAPASPAPSVASSGGSPSVSAAVCTDAAAFKAAISNLTNLKLAQVGASGVLTALTDVQASAQALEASGKDLIGPPISDLLTSVQGLQTTLAGLGDQPVGAKLVAVTTAIGQIKASASSVETALGTICPAS